MDSTKRVLKFQNHGLKKTVGVFWLVMLLVNILFSILAIFSINNIHIGPAIRHNSSLSIAGSNIMSIFIFLIIYGILMYHEDFALALSFGVTRKDFYKSVIVNNILVVIIFAIIQSIWQVLDKYVVEYLGFKALVDFGLFNVEKNSILFIIFVSATLYLTILSITNLIGVLQYRFGYRFWIGFGVTAISIQIVGNPFGGVISSFNNGLWSKLSGFTILSIASFIIVTCYILGYLLIRKVNIKK